MGFFLYSFIFIVTLVVGALFVYPSAGSAATFSCQVSPFSQTIVAGKSATYSIQASSVGGNRGQVILGDLPGGVTGTFVETVSIFAPGNFSVVLKTQRSAQVGSFSLVFVVEGEPFCQYALTIQEPPRLPGQPLEGEISEPGTPSPLAQKAGPSFGSRGIEVVELQRLLAKDASLYPEGLVTGWYGPLTTAAVQRFQLRVGIPPVGVVDAATQEKLDELREKQAPNAFKFQSYLIRGTRGNNVVILQNVLKQLGFFAEEVESTGYFGPITEASVKRYQESKGIETIGTVGPITRAALNQK